MKHFRKHFNLSESESYTEGLNFKYKIGKKVYESGWGKVSNSTWINDRHTSENHVVYEISIIDVDPIVKGFEKIKYLSVLFEQDYEFQVTSHSRGTYWEPEEYDGYYEITGDVEFSEADDGFNGYATLQDAIDNDISKEVVSDEGECLVNYFTDFDDKDIEGLLNYEEPDETIDESFTPRKNRVSEVRVAKNAVRVAEAKLRLAKKKLAEAELSTKAGTFSYIFKGHKDEVLAICNQKRKPANLKKQELISFIASMKEEATQPGVIEKFEEVIANLKRMTFEEGLSYIYSGILMKGDGLSMGRLYDRSRRY